jgi:nucleoside 2-deoxyribosyltransferase
LWEIRVVFRKAYNNLMKIVICGSMSASKQMIEMKKILEAKGCEVVLPKRADKYASGELPIEKNYESIKNKIEYDLIREYYSTIKNADAVIIANYNKGGIKDYVGGNSFLEAGFAHALNKELYFLNDIPDMIYSDELHALQPTILNGDLSLIKFIK